MIDARDIETWAGAALQECGFSGRGSVWRFRRPEVQWVVRVDRLPFGARFGVDVGLELGAKAAPRRPTDCGIVLYLENLPFAKELWVARTFDLDSDIDDGQRRMEVMESLRALGDYVAARSTFDEVRNSFRRGEFRSGFVRKDVRELLGSSRV